MTFFEAQRAAREDGHRLVDAGRTPNGLYRMLVCERCGGKILARSPEDAGGEIATSVGRRSNVVVVHAHGRYQEPAESCCWGRLLRHDSPVLCYL